MVSWGTVGAVVVPSSFVAGTVDSLLFIVVLSPLTIGSVVFPSPKNVGTATAATISKIVKQAAKELHLIQTVFFAVF